MEFKIAPATFIDDVLGIIDSLTSEFVKTGFETIANHWLSSGLFTSIFTLYILYFFYQAQLYSTPLAEVIVHLFKLVFVFMVATNWHIFYILIYNVATNEPLHILKILLPGKNGEGSLNETFITGIKQAVGLLMNMPFTFKGVICTVFAALVMIIGTLLFTLIGVALIMISKVYLAVYLALAPYFLFLFLFNSTKGLSESWIKACLNSALVPVFVGCILMVSTVLASACLGAGAMDSESKAPDFIGIVIYIATALLSAFLMKHVPEKTASLTSSLAIAGAGRIADYAKNLGSGAKNAASSVGKGASAAKTKFTERAQRVREQMQQRNEARSQQQEEERARRARSGF